MIRALIIGGLFMMTGQYVPYPRVPSPVGPVAALCIAASASGTTYTCTATGVAALTNGLTLAFQADVANTGAATLNVNSLGAKSIEKHGIQPLVGNPNIIAGQWSLLTYDGTNWQDSSQLGVATIPSFACAVAVCGGGLISSAQNTEWGFISTNSAIMPVVVNAPSAPYTVTARLTPNWILCPNDCRFGLLFRQSSTQKVTTWIIGKAASCCNTFTATSNWTSDGGTFVADILGVSPNNALNALTGTYGSVSPCLRIEDDNTNLSFWYSLDCLNFTQYGSNYARGTFMTGGPDQIGFTTGGTGSISGAGVNVVQWIVTQP